MKRWEILLHAAQPLFSFFPVLFNNGFFETGKYGAADGQTKKLTVFIFFFKVFLEHQLPDLLSTARLDVPTYTKSKRPAPGTPYSTVENEKVGFTVAVVKR